jgi:hypothetical protein
MVNSTSSWRRQAGTRTRESPSGQRDEKEGEVVLAAPLNLPYATNSSGISESLRQQSAQNYQKKERESQEMVLLLILFRWPELVAS